MKQQPLDVLKEIASRLKRINYQDLTKAERQIAEILMENGLLARSDNDDLLDETCKLFGRFVKK